MHMCDGRRLVAKDPGLDVHWSCFGVCYGHINNPLQAFTFVSCHGRKKNSVLGEEETRDKCEVLHFTQKLTDIRSHSKRSDHLDTRAFGNCKQRE